MVDENTEYISKTDIKKDCKKIQTFGKKIGALSFDEIISFNFPGHIFDAIKEYKAIKSNVAKKRQMQYLGRLFREIDLSQAYLRMEQIKNGSEIEKRNDRLAELWRNKLIHDKEALTELINLYPKIDRQKIRQLVQNSIKEKKESKPPKNFRQIFHLLKQHII